MKRTQFEAAFMPARKAWADEEDQLRQAMLKALEDRTSGVERYGEIMKDLLAMMQFNRR